jgi:hypothetical protein
MPDFLDFGGYASLMKLLVYLGWKDKCLNEGFEK